MNGAQGLLSVATDALIGRDQNRDSTTPEELRYPATIFVWGRWFICLACIILLIYRPVFSYFTYSMYGLCIAVLIAFNGYVHYSLLTGRTITLRWMLALSAIDVLLVTVGMIAAGGFVHYFFYLLYYPALTWFAIFFSSFRLSFTWVTMVALIYVLVSLNVGDGLDLEARDDKALFARIVVMYAVVASVNLVARFERIRRQEAVRRERELHQERIELSQRIHDTTAQSAYMIGIGIETATEMAENTSQELIEKLNATYRLSKSVMWELRHPIDIGHILEGKKLGQVLKTHADTFTTITSIPAKMVQNGIEPHISTATRSMLFSIAHNALTNAFRHARASQVVVQLDFHAAGIRLSVSDDGIGLPEDYASRGHGFKNMQAEAERMGGRLEVNSGNSGQGTTVSCVIECSFN